MRPEASTAHVEDLEAVVRGVDGEEVAVGREGQGTHLAALELDEGGRCLDPSGTEQEEQDGQRPAPGQCAVSDETRQ